MLGDILLVFKLVRIIESHYLTQSKYTLHHMTILYNISQRSSILPACALASKHHVKQGKFTTFS